MKLKKDENLEGLKVGTYLLHFNTELDNYYYNNFETLEDVYFFIEKKGLLNLYNEWLDFICSDYIATETEGYVIGKVLSLENNYYHIELIREV